jgi:vanillate O-demethylase monooxygenase subunit
MLEMQQKNLLDHSDRKLLKLNIDAEGVQARRLIERVLARERESESTPLVATRAD